MITASYMQLSAHGQMYEALWQVQMQDLPFIPAHESRVAAIKQDAASQSMNMNIQCLAHEHSSGCEV